MRDRIYIMENILPEKNNEIENSEKREKRILVVEGDLRGMGFSPEELRVILEKLNQLHREGKVETVEEAREIAPTIDLSELRGEQEKKPKPPRHTKRKGERY